jgi:hypothetical protein
VTHGDLGYSRWKVLHEYERRQHADLEQFRRDVERYSLMAAGGRLVLRFAGQHPHRAGRDRRANARCPAQPGSVCWAGVIIGSLPRTRAGAPGSRATSR